MLLLPVRRLTMDAGGWSMVRHTDARR